MFDKIVRTRSRSSYLRLRLRRLFNNLRLPASAPALQYCFKIVITNTTCPVALSCSLCAQSCYRIWTWLQSSLKKFLDHLLANNVEKVQKLCNKGLDPNFHCPDSGGECWVIQRQCWGFVTFWCGSGSADQYLWLRDPDPDFKDAKTFFFIFFSYNLPADTLSPVLKMIFFAKI